MNYFIPQQKTRFLESYYPYQQWQFPTYLIKYITMRPSNSKCYQKLAQTCKYFFIKNPIIVVERLCIMEKIHFACVLINTPYISLPHGIETKFWVTKEFRISGNKAAENYFIPNFYRIDAKRVEFNSSIIPFNLFVFLLPHVEVLILSCEAVKDITTDTNFLLQKYTKEFISSNAISLSEIYPISDVTPNSIKELLELPCYSKIKTFRLTDIPDTFDIKIFFTDIIKKNKLTKFGLTFCDSISEEYKALIEPIIDEILATGNRSYKVPYFNYPGINNEKYWKMHSLFCCS